MIDVAFRHAWMQKHPTPTTGGGDYHWHPAATPPEIRTALTELASRAGGAAASVWVAGPSYVAWGRTFSAVAPSDQRRYTGIAATIAEPRGDARAWSAVVPDVFHHLRLPPPAPLSGPGTSEWRTQVVVAAPMQPVDGGAVRELIGAGAQCEAFVRSVVFGGAAATAAPVDDVLPSLVGALLSWLPRDQRARARAASYTAAGNGAPTRASEAAGNLVHYLARAWTSPRRAAASRAWALVLDLADARRRELSALFDDLTGAAGAWDTAENLARYLVDSGVLSAVDIRGCDERAPRPLCDPSVADAGWLWNRLLNYWGRGFFGDTDRALVERLGGLLAMRIAADHLFHLDAPDQPALPERYLRRLRYESLLTRTRVAAMTEQLQRHLPSLEALRER